MKTTKLRMVPALLLMGALGACDTSLLDILPQDEIAEEIAIVDQETAQAALNGAYASLQSGSLYGGDFVLWMDLLTDDVEHTGTFGSYGQGDLLNIPADNGVVSGIWDASYNGINRVNVLLQKLPGLEDADADEIQRMTGEALALRALHYFDLVRVYGDVPLIVEPPANLDEASQVTRTPMADVYAQIHTDLGAARTALGAAGVTNGGRTYVTPGFIDALEAKVYLYQENWGAAITAAEAVMASGDYDLAGAYGDLFEADGAPTSEDIFRVSFISVDAQNYGYYYQYAGRFEIGATQDIYDAYDQANDLRWARNFDGTRSDGIQVVKYPTTVGTEDPHVIRYAEVLLILAEALAERNTGTDLADAVGYLNDVHTRAGLTPYNLVTDFGADAAQVLDAIYLERRLELAFEGNRWFDLVRTGRAAAALGAAWQPYKALLPVPQSERDVAPNLTQNDGYEN